MSRGGTDGHGDRDTGHMPEALMELNRLRGVLLGAWRIAFGEEESSERGHGIGFEESILVLPAPMERGAEFGSRRWQPFR